MSQLTISTHPFTTANPRCDELADQCTELWNAAYGDDFALSSRTFTWLAALTAEDEASLLVASENDVPVGFLLASHASTTAFTNLDALALLPDGQNQEIGQALLTAAYSSQSLASSSGWHVQPGPISLLPGLPEGSPLEGLLTDNNMKFDDIHRYGSINIATYEPPQGLKELPAAVYPAQPTQHTAILDFIRSQPQAELERLIHFVQRKRRLSDLMLLWTEQGLAGLCWLGFEDSPYPIELSVPYRLPRPWAQIGHYLLAPHLGDEYLALILDAGLRRFHNNGINSAVTTVQLPPTIWSQFTIQAYQSFRTFSVA